MKVVISIGGSLITRELSEGKISPENYRKYADALIRLVKDGHKVVAVCGAGRLKDYIKIGGELGADKVLQDRIGIDATHINAKLLIAALGEHAHPNSLRKVEEVKKHFGKKILVCGGDEPGCSTDYDATLFAEGVEADLLINATDIDGVYTADPDKDPTAKKFDRLTYDEFLDIILKNEQVPGEYRLFDLPAVKLIKKRKIKTIFIDGNDPEEIIRAVKGAHRGTVIQ